MTPEPDDPAPASARPEAAGSPSRWERLRGPWRVVVAEGSMLPTIAPGDWLLIDPTVRRWPRPGSLVVFREPNTDTLAIKRVLARSGERAPFNGGFIVIGEDEAWLTSDATPTVAAAAGFGPPIDSERYGPVESGRLVGRVWFRYGPPGRIGRLGRTRPTE
ncbi:MAG: S26 family signal peptidase [Chloroflexota bacterium]